jgi:hypothetical protein
MKPRYIKRIIKDDFPQEVRTWIDTLLYPLNASIEQNSQILQKNISLIDNLAAEVRTLQIVGSSLITGNSTEGSNIITDSVYYQAVIDGVNYGVQPGQPVAGLGLPPGTTVVSVSGSTITLSQNSNITQKNAKYQAGGFFPLRLSYNLSFRPTSVFVSNIADLQGNPTYISEGVTPQWRIEGRDIVIDGISGLEAGRSYNITFVIL